jgi:hypothetical protein
MRHWRVGLLVLVCSCISAAANENHERRMKRIGRAYESDAMAIEGSYRAALRKLGEVEAMLIAVKPNANSQPKVRVDDGVGLAMLREACAEMRITVNGWDREGSDVTAARATLQNCDETYSNELINALVKTYWAADVGWIAGEMNAADSMLDLESLFVYSHNLRLRALIDGRRKDIVAARDEALERLHLLREEVIATSRDMRDAEIAEKERRLMLVLAGAAQGMAAASRPASAHATTVVVTQPVPVYTTNPYARSGVEDTRASGCASDFDCGVGGTCVKPYYSGTGACARSVNEYGGQTFDLPRTNSIFVNVPDDADCKLFTDCPVGFRCDASSGACVQ